MLCVNAVHCTRYVFEPLPNGNCAFDLLVEYSKTLGRQHKVVLAAPEGLFSELPAGWVLETRENWSASEFFATIRAHSESLPPEDTTLLFLHADSPFLSVDLTLDLLKLHQEQRVQYSFADGYPEGMTPELIDRRVLSALESLSVELPMQRNILFETVAKDINSFDVETELAPADYRDLRLQLYCDGPRNTALCSSLIQAGGLESSSRLLAIIREQGELRRTLPSFAAVEVCTLQAQELRYYPQYRNNSGQQFMSSTTFEALCRALTAYAPEITVSISVPGEIGLHPEPEKLVQAAGAAGVRQLLVETGGCGWKDTALEAVHRANSKLQIVVDLDALQGDIYTQLRGSGYEEATAFAEKALALFGTGCYIGSTRSQINEADLDSFYEHWKRKGAQVLIRKYDHFCGRLPDLRVTDLSPLKRHPCRHLERDLSVAVDGTAYICLEDIDRAYPLGNILQDGVKAVWEAGAPHFRAHLDGKYPELCRNCDEYYTFNF